MRLGANRLSVIAAVAALAGFGPSAATAASFEVAPTKLELPSGTNTAVLYVSNHGAEPITVQIETFDWRQAGVAERLEPSETLQVSPPLARIVPGGRQTVRLQVKPTETRGERAFRLLVSQLPDAKAKPIRGVRVLLQFSVPIFANVARTKSARLTWDAAMSGNGLSLIARNDGLRHAKITNLALITPNRRIEIAPKKFSYILPGASLSWKIAASDVRTGETLHVEGRDESAGAPIKGSLVVRR